MQQTNKQVLEWKFNLYSLFEPSKSSANEIVPGVKSFHLCKIIEIIVIFSSSYLSSSPSSSYHDDSIIILWWLTQSSLGRSSWHSHIQEQPSKHQDWSTEKKSSWDSNDTFMAKALVLTISKGWWLIVWRGIVRPFLQPWHLLTQTDPS